MFRDLLVRSREGQLQIVFLRKTQFIFWGIVAGLVVNLMVLLVFVISIGNVSQDSGGSMGLVSSLLLLVPGVILSVFFCGVLMTKLIRYFFDIVFVHPKSIEQFDYQLFFKEREHVAELYRVLSLDALQSGVFQTIGNFGKIVLTMQDQSTIPIRNIPSPKKVVELIEKMKEQTIEYRIGDELGEKKLLDQRETQKQMSQAVGSNNNLTGRKEKAGKLLYEKGGWLKKTLKKVIKKEIKNELREKLKEEIKEELEEDILENRNT